MSKGLGVLPKRSMDSSPLFWVSTAAQDTIVICDWLALRWRHPTTGRYGQVRLHDIQDNVSYCRCRGDIRPNEESSSSSINASNLAALRARPSVEIPPYRATIREVVPPGVEPEVAVLPPRPVVLRPWRVGGLPRRGSIRQDPRHRRARQSNTPGTPARSAPVAHSTAQERARGLLDDDQGAADHRRRHLRARSLTS